MKCFVVIEIIISDRRAKTERVVSTKNFLLTRMENLSDNTSFIYAKFTC